MGLQNLILPPRIWVLVLRASWDARWLPPRCGLLGKGLCETSWENPIRGQPLHPELPLLQPSPRPRLSNAAAEPGHVPHCPSPSWLDLGAASSHAQAGAPDPAHGAAQVRGAERRALLRGTRRGLRGRGGTGTYSSHSGLAVLGPVPEQAPECCGHVSFYKLLLHFITRSLFSSPLFLQTDDRLGMEGFFPLRLDQGHSME